MKKGTLLAVFVLIITFVSANQFSSFPIGDTTFVWILNFLTIGCVFWCKRTCFHPLNKKDYRPLTIYLLWFAIGIVRGIAVAENYWEWKQLITGTFALAVPIFIYVFSSPQLLQQTLRVWCTWALPAFALFFIMVLDTEAYHFYLSPLFLVACFLPILSKRWIAICLVLLMLMITIDLGARSQVIKSVITLLVSVAYILSKYISVKILKFAHWLCYIVPVVVLVLGLSGIYNPFERLSENQGKYIENRVTSGETVQEDLAIDTRTFIYQEVIGSAIAHDYVLFGRTPARGNDSEFFGAHMAEELNTNKYERHRNELCHLNVFTWLGLIGMLLYGFLYLKSSFLALYRSNNLFMKLLGGFIAFRWAYGWIEDTSGFNTMNIAIWMMIAMGFSESFRRMNDAEFRVWVRGIFSHKRNF